jgi:type I restriction enzyme R subunit
MSPTDISEKGLETLIVESLVNEAGYELGSNEDYSREHVINWSGFFSAARIASAR